MTGPGWAALAGVGFGLFQSLNRQTLRGMDVWQSTFLQLLVSAVILLAATLATEDVGGAWLASPGALAAFLVAGLVHFFVGWMLLNASQKRIGAARTSPLLAATPLFGAILAAVALGEVPGPVAVAAMLLIVAGVYLTLGTGIARGADTGDTADAAGAGGPRGVGGAGPGGGPGTARAAGDRRLRQGGWRRLVGTVTGWRASLPGLGTAACWAVSPLLVRQGLRTLPSPLLGVTFGMFGATVPQGLVLVMRRRRGLSQPVAWEAMPIKLAAGVLVGLSTWTRWVALDLSPVAVVLALGLLSVPTVMLVAPPLAGRHEERVTPRVWLGAALVVGGSVLLVLRG